MTSNEPATLTDKNMILVCYDDIESPTENSLFYAAKTQKYYFLYRKPFIMRLYSRQVCACSAKYRGAVRKLLCEDYDFAKVQHSRIMSFGKSAPGPDAEVEIKIFQQGKVRVITIPIISASDDLLAGAERCNSIDLATIPERVLSASEYAHIGTICDGTRTLNLGPADPKRRKPLIVSKYAPKAIPVFPKPETKTAAVSRLTLKRITESCSLSTRTVPHESVPEFRLKVNENLLKCWNLKGKRPTLPLGVHPIKYPALRLAYLTKTTITETTVIETTTTTTSTVKTTTASTTTTATTVKVILPPVSSLLLRSN
jgi:hypothetical protein